MTDPIFPTLPGLSWSVLKSPIFQTRIQRAVSGRELRSLDYPFPLWQYTLTYDFLRDSRPAFDELRTLMGFFMTMQGAFGNFLYADPTDNFVVGQPLPPATCIPNGVSPSSGGSGYQVNNIVTAVGGSGVAPTFIVNSVDGAGGILTLTLVSPGALAVIPGLTNVPVSGGNGSGATLNISWITKVQLSRSMGGFLEPVTAPSVLSNIYYNTILVDPAGYSVDSQTGLVTLPFPFYYYYLGGVVGFNSRGTGYAVNDILTAVGGSLIAGGSPLRVRVVAINGTPPFFTTGSVATLLAVNLGNYSVPPSTSVDFTGGSGSGMQLNVGWTINQPSITADFSYYIRCRFVNDSNVFENFMLGFWQLKQISFISVRN